MSRLIDAYPRYYAAGVFSDMFAIDGPNYPWLLKCKSLDVEYFANHSGDKETSPLVDKFSLYNDSDELTEDQRETIATILLDKFGDKWDRLYKIFKVKYNPIENYSMVEIDSPDIRRDHIVSPDYEVTRKTETDNQTGGDVYGFNSSDPVGATKSSADGITTESNSQKGYTSDIEHGERKLTRSGNIGATTSQQMVRSEVDLWTSWTFFETVFDDVDSLLTSPIYDY